MWGGLKDDAELDPEKVRAALKKHDEGAKGLASDERKRDYNSLSAADVHVTPEEMEAYNIKKARRDDPLVAIEKGKRASSDGYDLV